MIKQKRRKGRVIVCGAVLSRLMFSQRDDNLIFSGQFYKKLSWSYGGSGYFQAIYCEKSGIDVNIVGTVGDDEYGNALIFNLNSYGIATDCIKKITYLKTGVEVLTINEKSDWFENYWSGANYEVSREDIDYAISEINDESIVISQLDISTVTILHLLKKSRSAGAITMLNSFPASSIPKSIYKYCNYIVVGERDLFTLFGKNVNNALVNDQIQIMEQLLKMGVDCIICMLNNGSVSVVKKQERITIINNKDPLFEKVNGRDKFIIELANIIINHQSIVKALINNFN